MTLQCRRNTTAIFRTAGALYQQYVDEISQHMGTDGTTERRPLVSASPRPNAASTAWFRIPSLACLPAF